MSDASIPAWVRAAREGWTYRGASRPSFAVVPGPGQESVWDYPRPPVLVPDPREVVVRSGPSSPAVIARSALSVRMLETSHPPTFYVPREAVNMDLLTRAGGGSMCEWKGACTYYDVTVEGRRYPRVCWSYEAPFEEATPIKGHLAFYASVFECFVAGERVQPQPGGFYGGWITPELVGPFKGEPGTEGW